MSKGVGFYLAVLMIAAFVLPLGQALPSAFEKDKSQSDLEELESMLSGEHRGSSYSEATATSSAPQPVPSRPDYDSPYKDVFRNDTFFGDFVRQMDNDTMPQDNRTWADILLNATGQKAAAAGRHFIKPVLIKEPEF